MPKSLIFYGKPSCINNRKQVRLLMQAGVEVVQKDIFDVQWCDAMLAKFFSGVALRDCVNSSAPSIKSGEIVAENLSRSALFCEMRLNPVLIRRPLIVYEGKHWVGFDWNQLCIDIGLDPIEPVGMSIDPDIEICTKNKVRPQ